MNIYPSSLVKLYEIDQVSGVETDLNIASNNLFGVAGDYLFVSKLSYRLVAVLNRLTSAHFVEYFDSVNLLPEDVYTSTIFKVNGDGSLNMYQKISNTWTLVKTGFVYNGSALKEVGKLPEEFSQDVQEEYTISPTPSGMV